MASNSRNSQPDMDRLARLVGDRRRVLGLSRDQVAAQGGPSAFTLQKIELGTWDGWRRPDTLQKIDAGLRWEAGSTARAMWEESEPVPLPEARPTTALAETNRSAMADTIIEITVRLEIASQSAWTAFNEPNGQSNGAAHALSGLETVAMLAEKLALQIVGGDEYATRRRAVRARLRTSSYPTEPSRDGSPMTPERRYGLDSGADQDVEVSRDAAREILGDGTEGTQTNESNPA